MASIISLNCIEQTISNLNYRSEKSLKYRLLKAIRQFYTDESSVRTLETIPPERLIEFLWETGSDTHLVNKKRKNLNSVRSSVNGDLQKLYKEGNNPDGITISPENIFVMSDEAKDKALKSFIEKIPGDAPANLDEISKILNVVNDILSKPEATQTEDPSDRLQKLSEMKNLMQSLSEKIGLQETDSDEIGNDIGIREPGDSGPENTPGDVAESESQGMKHPAGSNTAEDGSKSENQLKDEDDIPESMELDEELEELEFLDELEPETTFGEEGSGETGVGLGDRAKDTGLDGSGETGDGPRDRTGDAGLGESGDGPGDRAGNADLAGPAGEGQASEGDNIGHAENEGKSDLGDGGQGMDGAPLPIDESDDSEITEIEDDLEKLEFLDEFETEDALDEDLETLEFLDELVDEGAPGEDESGDGPDDRSGDGGNADSGQDGSAGEGQTSEDDSIGHGENEGNSGLGDTGQGMDGAPLSVDEVDDPETIEIEDDLEEVDLLEEIDLEDDPDEDGPAGSGDNEQGTDSLPQPVDEEDVPEITEIEDDLEEVDLLEEIDIEDNPGEDESAGSGDNEQGTDSLPLPVDEEDEPEITEIGDDLEEIDLLEEIDFEDDLDEDGVDGSGSGHQGDGENTGNTADTNEAPGTPTTMAVDNDLDAFEIGDDAEWRDDPKKARYLAETFNRSLAAMDKFYNQYIQIPEGKYIVGASQPKKNEKSKQIIALASFYIGKFPVTNALFEVFVEKTGYKTTAEKRGFGTVYEGRYQKTVDPHAGLEKHCWRADIVSNTVKGAFWYQPAGPDSNIHKKRNHPVVQVSIHDAMAFAAWTGKRLPTEEEWEAASRTANGFHFPWGNDWQSGTCNIEESYMGDTTPVDCYLDFENEFGLADTLGNVLEWTFCPAPPQSESNQPASFIAKGGGWISGNDLRLSSHFQMEPESHSNLLGFRNVAY